MQMQIFQVFSSTVCIFPRIVCNSSYIFITVFVDVIIVVFLAVSLAMYILDMYEKKVLFFYLYFIYFFFTMFA